jgi:anti-sigma B factor antagonist
MTEMMIQQEPHGPATIVIAAGRLDFGAAPEFQAALERAVAGAGRSGAVVIDGAALEYVSSAGLRAFLIGAKAAQRAGCRYGVCALQPAVREVFDLSGFSKIIAVHADRAAALAAAGAPA